MVKLTPKEEALLASIEANEELRPLFFKKAHGLKWFDHLDEKGYFDPVGNEAPVASMEEGYVTVPFWHATEYLVATSSELLALENREYASRVLGILRSTTQIAKDGEFGNYRTWLQFSKIIQNIPIELITSEDLDAVDYWLGDKYDHGLVSVELGEKWLVSLLDQSSEEARKIAVALLQNLVKVSFISESLNDSGSQQAIFRFEYYHAKKIIDAAATKSGQVLHQQAVQIFYDELERVITTLENDSWSTLWRRSVGKHAQNSTRGDAQNALIDGLRDSLNAFTCEVTESARAEIQRLLQSPFQLIKRVAIYVLSKNFSQLSELAEAVITSEHFDDRYRHEMWHLLHDCYPQFTEATKSRVQEITGMLAVTGENEEPNPKATAYKQAIWLSAIRKHDVAIQEQYQERITFAGVEPDHPDFSIYSSVESLVHESPRTSEELLAMSVGELIDYLNGYKDPGDFMGPGIEGLVKAFKSAVKAAPLTFFANLEKLHELDCAYIYVLIEAFSEMWAEKKSLPWDDIWRMLFVFCGNVVQREEFWLEKNAEARGHFIANRLWVVGSIGRLIESGTKSDMHAFPQFHLDQAKYLLLTLLEKEVGEEFQVNSDAVHIAINSPRGHCLEALINLALRSCRLADKEGDSHEVVWDGFQEIFDSELAKSENNEYEFITLLVYYLPNFKYMSNEWVIGNLDRIFERNVYQKWLCAMQGYASVNYVYQEIYTYLQTNSHFIDALDDANLKERVSEKIIQNIVFAYINNFENLEDGNSLIRQLLNRSRSEELSRLIWYIWTLRQNSDKISDKVIALWPRLLEVINTESREGRKLASRLTTWSVFISDVNSANRDLILGIARYADEDYNSHGLLETIARISVTQPNEAYRIWEALLDGSSPDYPEEAIRETFSNLINTGHKGYREALSIADRYIRWGNDRPNLWLQEILSLSQR